MAKKTKHNPLVLLGVVVQTLRKEKLISQEMLSEQCGIDRSYLSRIERGTANPSIAVVLSLAEAFGIETSTIFKKIEDQIHGS